MPTDIVAAIREAMSTKRHSTKTSFRLVIIFKQNCVKITSVCFRLNAPTSIWYLYFSNIFMAPGHFSDGHFFDGHFFDGHFFDGTYFRRDIFSTSNKMGHIFDMTFSIKILLTNLT